MLFRSPVTLPLHPKSWNDTAGNNDFKITQYFGCTGFSWERPLGNCAHFHRGLDIWNGRFGDPVVAAQDGTVHFAGRLNDGAIVVEINHGGGWFSLYAHLQNEVVSVGQRVSKGQKIGELGSTGRSTGPHLHFAVKSDAFPPYGSIAGDSEGKWRDPWPRLEQNVTIEPKPATDGINIRTSASTGAAIFARTKGGRIIKHDGKDLGSVQTDRKWGGSVTGGSYSVGGTSSDKWEKIYLDGGYRYIARALALKSAS